MLNYIKPFQRVSMIESVVIGYPTISPKQCPAIHHWKCLITISAIPVRWVLRRTYYQPKPCSPWVAGTRCGRLYPVPGSKQYGGLDHQPPLAGLRHAVRNVTHTCSHPRNTSHNIINNNSNQARVRNIAILLVILNTMNNTAPWWLESQCMAQSMCCGALYTQVSPEWSLPTKQHTSQY